MKHRLMIFLLIAVWAAPSMAQQQVVHFKKLQEALPTMGLSGFTRAKPAGSTQTAMGMSTSEASVRYTKSGEDGQEIAIVVKISDTVGTPFGGLAFAFPSGETEMESESGYKKTVTVKKKYKAMLEAITEDYQSCTLTFPVANRFLVELHGDGTSDAKLLTSLAENMMLEKLEGAVSGK